MIDTPPTGPQVDPQAIDRGLSTLRWIAFAMLDILPIIVLVVCSQIHIAPKPEAGARLVLYILLVVAAVDPLAALLLEKVWLSGFSKARSASTTGVKAVQGITITKLAFVGAIYIYALVVYLVLGDFMALLYFYPIGIIWSAVMWPRRERFERLVKIVESR